MSSIKEICVIAADEVKPDTLSSPPNWDNVPFDVGCARCGQDLRGASEPKCPACSLEFDWAEAVPIEKLTCAHCGYHLYGLAHSRCPECGKAFDWNEALDSFRRTRLPYFEYRWRDAPMRSLFRTWRLALSPRRFWQRINLHDPPNAVALIIMVLSGIGMTFAAFVAQEPIEVAAEAAEFALSAGRSVRLSDFSDIPVTLVASVGRGLTDANNWSVTGFVALWTISSLGSLLIFRQSMRRCRLRTVQVLRVWAYANSMALPMAVLLAGVAVALPRIVPVDSYDTGALIACVMVLLAWAHVVWSLRWGYRVYLRMPHAFAVAICAQIIAVLFALTIALFPAYISLE